MGCVPLKTFVRILVLALLAVVTGGCWLAETALLGLSLQNNPQPLPTVATPPEAGRVLSMSLVPRLVPPPTQQDYVAAFDLAASAGVRGDQIAWTWSDLEPAPGQFKLDDPMGGLRYSSFRGNTQLVTLQVLNTTAKETPADLLNVPFDSPQMSARFHALIDALLPYFDQNVRYMSIGNEVDVYLNDHPDEWASYTTFYEDAVDYLHRVAPGIRIGVTSTFSGAAGGALENVTRLNRKSDVLILTYYPTGAFFDVNDPAVPLADFPTMLGWAGTRPLILQEVGYPSASLLQSSEEKQAAFVTNVFRAWNKAGERIPFLSYFALHDFDEALCNKLEGYYGVKDANFHAFLCTLGLRKADGTPKPGWQAFVEAAHAAGFPQRE